MFAEDDLLPISALQHWLYCPRQACLIHVERAWAENRLTVEGRQLHGRAHRAGGEAKRDGTRAARGLAVRSLALGLFGIADVVEFPADGGPPFPVEYKRGRPKSHDADRVQLCAQGMCLEEMLGAAVPGGAIFYGKTRRREAVAFTPALRALVEATAAALHAALSAGRTLAARYERRKCDRCSLKGLCLPAASTGGGGASRYLGRALDAVLAGAGPVTDGG
ncbi:MAG TPA: CRISPR-associated protein Cas4 [Tepidisphaeraceae bacterium]|nr:CRISPR-associated protein Cas4 [Tepidisphaeraceae bacterium]